MSTLKGLLRQEIMMKRLSAFLYCAGIVCSICFSTESFADKIAPIEGETEDGEKTLLFKNVDESHLKFIIRSNKSKYKMGEPIFIKTIIHYSPDMEKYFIDDHTRTEYVGANIITIVDEKGNDVEMNRYAKSLCRGERYYKPIINWGGTSTRGDIWSNAPDHEKNHKKTERKAGSKGLEVYPLNVYFDLSKPGVYKISYCRRLIFFGSVLDPPLKSNTIEIEVENSIFTVGGLYHPGEFIDHRPEKRLKTP